MGEPEPEPERVLPELPDDMLRNILIRLQPNHPECLVRAYYHYPTWRNLLCDPSFCRFYRESHGQAPLLGVLENSFNPDKVRVARFNRTTSFSPPGGAERLGWHALSARHGRALFALNIPRGGDEQVEKTKSPLDFIVWDPFTDNQHRFSWPEHVPYVSMWSAAVLCAATGGACDHVACNDDPFSVALMGFQVHDGKQSVFATLFSSDTGEWGPPISAPIEFPGAGGVRFAVGHGWAWPNTVVMGRTVRVLCEFCWGRPLSVLMELDLDMMQLSVIEVPVPKPFEINQNTEQEDEIVTEEDAFLAADDSHLVFVSLKGTKLHLWTRMLGADPNGGDATWWKERKIIQLDGPASRGPWVFGLADGVVLLSTPEDGSFMVNLTSGDITRVSDLTFRNHTIPYLSFFTLDHSRLRMN